LEKRESVIKELTQGYLKDVHHVKEMMFKKTNVREYVDVKFFDESLILDDKSRDIMNRHIGEMHNKMEV
jgi:hypothetical protein